MACLCCEMFKQLSNLLRVLFLWLRYRAVASWSRVQGVGIPLFTAIEIFSIWVLSIILAVPEAVVFNMVTFTYKNQTFRTCMLKPESNLMMVRFNGTDVMPTSFPFAHINTQTLCNKQCICPDDLKQDAMHCFCDLLQTLILKATFYVNHRQCRG